MYLKNEKLYQNNFSLENNISENGSTQSTHLLGNFCAEHFITSIFALFLHSRSAFFLIVKSFLKDFILFIMGWFITSSVKLWALTIFWLMVGSLVRTFGTLVLESPAATVPASAEAVHLQQVHLSTALYSSPICLE